MSYDRDDPRDYDYRDRRRDPYDRDSFERQPSDKVAAARGSVMAPAIVLIVLGIFNLLGGLGSLGCGTWLQRMTPDDFEEKLTEDDPNALDDLTDEGLTVEDIKAIYAVSGIVIGVLSMLAAAILILGGARMLALKWYAFAFVAAVTAMISPGGCCIFGVIG